MVAMSKEESLSVSLLALKVGNSASRSHRIALEDSEGTRVDDVLAKLRNRMNNAVGRLRANYDGTNFRVESVAALTSDKAAIIATVVATRLSGEVEGDEDPDI